ncbi:MAG: methyltransferase protein [Moraxellaceae bacterium]|nr:methyltransferase protein [Moraxellaceae bacterium]
MTPPSCNVCSAPLGELLYESAPERSLTSLGRIYEGTTRVYSCTSCAHLQSTEMHAVDEFYDLDYDILVDSEEEDQIYEVRAGKPVYRTEHQVAVLLQKLDLPSGAKLLDYGCAKSSTVRMLLQQRPDLVPHLFDVSERYIPFWERFVQPENWATYEPRSEWEGRFDVVTSFFSLEHIVQPVEAMVRVARFLRPGGRFYCIVPNVFTNTADFIVADHVNHFTRPSLERLIADAGLRVVEIDDAAHRGAWVIVAEHSGMEAVPTPEGALAPVLAELARIGRFWDEAGKRVAAFEAQLAPDTPVAIYGAGFYGAFVAANLARPDNVRCHLDQNAFLQGRQMNGKPILPPAELPAEVRTLLVGLNPAHARRIIADIPALAARELDCFFF